MNYIYENLLKIDALINDGKYENAYNDLILLDSKYPKNNTIKLAKVGILIDIGLGLKKQQIIKKGLKIGKILLNDKLYEKYFAIISYNIANGYYSLFVLTQNSQILKPIYDDQNLQKSKKYFRITMANESNLDFDTKLKALTNYGNCLDTLNRGIEAMDMYDTCLQFKPNFAMALGNKAMQLKNFSEISGEYKAAIFITAHQMLIKATQDPSLIQYGGLVAKDSFESVINEIERHFKDKSILSRPIVHKDLDFSKISKFEKSYYEFCIEENLYLNLHIHQSKCEAALQDSIFIKLTADYTLDENIKNLINSLNQLKEDFVIARISLFLAKNKNQSFNNISLQTLYANTYDYSGFNLYIGFLKNSFKQSFDILDKIANFINLYLNIGLIEKNIKFCGTSPEECIWMKEGNIREKIKKTKNESLFALYDIFHDFRSQQFLDFILIRNAITHRKLVVYHANLENLKFDAEKSEIGRITLERKTIELIKIVRAAIIYLINFVEKEEENIRKNHKFLPPIYLDSYQFLDF